MADSKPTTRTNFLAELGNLLIQAELQRQRQATEQPKKQQAEGRDETAKK